MRGFVSSIFNLFVVLTSIFLFGAGTHWITTRQLGELDAILLLTGFLLAGIVFAHKLFVADFEPLSITRPRRRVV
jgi:hypothetical protein